MSIGSIASSSSWWNQQVAAMQALQSASGATGTTGATSTTSTAGSNSTSSTSSTGTSASSTQPTPFFVDFASDLQAMLAQITGSGTTSGGTTGTTTGTTQTADTNTADPTSSTDPTTSTQGTQRRHHHGDDGSTQGDATQLVGSAVQTLQNTASGTADTAAAAGTFAGDVMQALQAYGGTAALATVTAAA